jgi:hypothetical protein
VDQLAFELLKDGLVFWPAPQAIWVPVVLSGVDVSTFVKSSSGRDMVFYYKSTSEEQE